jgi:phosphatidylethanolamine-binding protein (PEBP) family uncharacterized protein
LSVAGFRLQSNAFEHGEPIPRRHGCEGEDLSPPLAWSGVPEGTRSLGWGIDAAAERLGEGEGTPVEGRNDFGTSGYGGPCPPPGHGPHRYSFRLYALDSDLGLPPGSDKGDLERALEGHTLGVAELVGTYER